MSAEDRPAGGEQRDATRSDVAGADPADLRWMDAALALGRRNLGITWPNPSVGALVLDADGHVAGRGWTAPGGRPHAETEALRRAGTRAEGGTVYVTLEPCSHYGHTPPCASALLEAGVARVVVATGDPNPLVAGKGVAMLRAAGVAVETGIRAGIARRDHAGHISRITRGRPHVQLKIAASQDGRSALAGRRPVRITGESARNETFLLRARADAIMVGIGTVIADDPELTCRLPGMEQLSPMRIVVDSDLRTPVEARLVQTARIVPTLVLAGEDASRENENRLRLHGVEIVRVAAMPTGQLWLSAALLALASRGLTRILVEGGPRLSAGLLGEDLVDEFLLFRGPGRLGEGAVHAVDGMSLDAVAADPRWLPPEDRMLGPDHLLHFWRR